MLNLITYSYISNRYGKGTKVQNIQSVIRLLEREDTPKEQISSLEVQLKENEMLAFGMPAEHSFEAYADKLHHLLKQLD